MGVVVGVMEGAGESGRTGGEVEQNHSAERNQPSDAPDTWQSFGRGPTETTREDTGGVIRRGT